jgi:hypothetical protein
MSNTTTIYGLIALFAAGMFFSSPLAVSAAVTDPEDNAPQPYENGNFLEIKKAIVNIDNDVIREIIYKTGGFVPHDEAIEPFGYGVITKVPSQTGTGTELNVIATTSHAGLLDSDAQQGDPANPILHNHYAVLGSNPACGSNPSIKALSEEELGQVFVKGKTVIVKDLPPAASAQLGNTEIEITPGTDIQFVASFLLQVVGPQNNPVVCVTDIMPVEPQDKRTVIFGEKDFNPDYPRPGYENSDDGYENGYEYPNEISYDEQYDHNQRY